MAEDNKKELKMDELENVTGGTDSTPYDVKRKEFDKAWVMTKMEKRYSGMGMDRGELFDDWLNRGDISAAEFLLSLFY